MRRWLAGGFALAGLWLFVRGTSLHPEAILASALTGIVIALPLAYAFRRFYEPDIHIRGSIRSIPTAIRYLVTFLWELVTANFDVAYRVLHPAMPIEPDVIELPLRVESDLAITTIANSITLTPGTLSMDYDNERNAIYVHAMYAPSRQAVVDPIRRWEDLALVIFDEKRSPEDPVPEPGGGDDGE